MFLTRDHLPAPQSILFAEGVQLALKAGLLVGLVLRGAALPKFRPPPGLLLAGPVLGESLVVLALNMAAGALVPNTKGFVLVIGVAALAASSAPLPCLRGF